MSREAGARAENDAAEFLQAKGWRILERNFRTRFGEIDLVARDGDTIVFVEVRSPRQFRFPELPRETVNAAKRRRIVRTAQAYAQSRRLDAPMRFDVVALSPRGILHLPAAFDATEVGL